VTYYGLLHFIFCKNNKLYLTFCVKNFWKSGQVCGFHWTSKSQKCFSFRAPCRGVLPFYPAGGLCSQTPVVGASRLYLGPPNCLAPALPEWCGVCRVTGWTLHRADGNFASKSSNCCPFTRIGARRRLFHWEDRSTVYNVAIGLD